jgi:hypothetical protein
VASAALAVAFLVAGEAIVPVRGRRHKPHRGTWRAFFVVGRSVGVPRMRQIDLETPASFGRIPRSIVWVAGTAWVQKDSFVWMPGTHGRYIGAKEFGIPVHDLKEVSFTGVSNRWTGVVLCGHDGWEAWLLVREPYAELMDALGRQLASSEATQQAL